MTLKYNLLLSVLVLVSIVFMDVSKAIAQQDGRAGIIISPTRVTLEGRERSGMISVANNGSAEGTYRAELVNRRMLENGGFEEVKDKQAGEKFADEFLRISPRRFTLKPGQHQNIRILARKPVDLEEGEYRSHLRFVIVPNELPKSEAPENTLSISVSANFGMSIPVIVRHGAINGGVSLSDLAFHKGTAQTQQKPRVTFTMQRDGKASVYGDLMVLYQPAGGNEVVVKNMGGIAVYTPNPKRTFDLLLDVPEDVQIGKGVLKVIYREKESAGGALIAQKEIAL